MSKKKSCGCHKIVSAKVKSAARTLGKIGGKATAKKRKAKSRKRK
jgi:hypothetical protein